MEIAEIKEKLIEVCLKAGKTLDDVEKDWVTFQNSDERVRVHLLPLHESKTIKNLDVSKAEKMYNDGFALGQVAAEFGVPSSIIVRKMVGAGWSVKLKQPTIKESYQTRLLKSRKLASEVRKHYIRTFVPQPYHRRYARSVRAKNFIDLLRYVMADKSPMTPREIVSVIAKMLMKDRVNYRLPTRKDKNYINSILRYHSSIFERQGVGIYQLKEN